MDHNHDSDTDSSCTITGDTPDNAGSGTESTSMGHTSSDCTSANDVPDTPQIRTNSAFIDEAQLRKDAADVRNAISHEITEEDWAKAIQEFEMVAKYDNPNTSEAHLEEYMHRLFDTTPFEAWHNDPSLIIDFGNQGSLDVETALPTVHGIEASNYNDDHGSPGAEATPLANPTTKLSQNSPWDPMPAVFEPMPMNDEYFISSAEIFMQCCKIPKPQPENQISSRSDLARKMVLQMSTAVKTGLRALTTVAKIGKDIDGEDDDHLATACERASGQVGEILSDAMLDLDHQLRSVKEGDRGTM